MKKSIFISLFFLLLLGVLQSCSQKEKSLEILTEVGSYDVTKTGKSPIAGDATLEGILDFNQEISILTKNKIQGILEGQGTSVYSKQLPDLGLLVETEEVQEAVQNFLNYLYEVYDSETEHVEVLVNIFGNKAGLKVPTKLVEDITAVGGRVITGGNLGLDCYCSKGTSTCSKKSTLGVTTCTQKSGCTECTLE